MHVIILFKTHLEFLFAKTKLAYPDSNWLSLVLNSYDIPFGKYVNTV